MATTIFQTQSALDQQANLLARELRGEFVDKTKWFDVPDSEIRDENGELTGEFNVQAKFADHPILNVEKSRAARHNVYELGIVLHTKVLRLNDATPAIKNGTSHVMRFDKGEDQRVSSYRQGPDGKEVVHYDGKSGMGKDAFDAAVKDVSRCWDAWEHYQKFRQSPVHPLEVRALEIINTKPLAERGTVLVDMGNGKLAVVKLETEDEDDGGDDTPLPPIRRNSKSRKVKATA